MLEFIFQGFFEWVYSLVLECWQYFSSSLLNIMSLDFAYIKSHVPVVTDIMQIILAVGWALLLGNLVFQALRSMASGLGFEGEDPKLLFARSFVFAFLLLASPQICETVLNLTTKVIVLLDVPDAVNVHLVDSSLFGSLTASWALVIIFDIILIFMVLSLLLEVAERYVILAMLTITAPLAFAMGGSRSTSEIFTGWCRMFGSMCLLMTTNIIFFKMLMSVVSTVPSNLDVFPWMVLIVSIVKVAKKADEIITRIGLNPAITGNRSTLPGILMYTVFRTALSMLTKTALVGMTGGAGAALGGAGIGAGTTAGVGAASKFGSVHRGATSGQTAQSTGRQEQDQQVRQNGETKPSSQEHSSQVFQGFSARSSRQTSVPPGTRRSPGHVKGNDTVTGRTSNAGVSPNGPSGSSEMPSGGQFRGAGFGNAAQRSNGFGGMRGGGFTKETARGGGFSGADSGGTGSTRGGGFTKATARGAGFSKTSSTSSTVTQNSSSTKHTARGSGFSAAASSIQGAVPKAEDLQSGTAGTGQAPAASMRHPTAAVPVRENRTEERNGTPGEQITGGTQPGARSTRFSRREQGGSVSRPGTAGTLSPSAQASRTSSGPAQQEHVKGTASPVAQRKSGISSPARQETARGLSPTAAPAARQSISPTRQEAGKARSSAKAPAKKGTSPAKPGTAGTVSGGARKVPPATGAAGPWGNGRQTKQGGQGHEQPRKL